MLKNFRTYQLSVKFYQVCKTMKLPHYLQDQLLHASSSVALNLAEGSGKRTQKDKGKFYYHALGSLKECQAIFDLHGVDETTRNLSNFLGASIYKLCKSTGP